MCIFNIVLKLLAFQSCGYGSPSQLMPLCSPYDGLWSKSMVGFGPEDNHFVVELTYNYGVKKYKRGNDFQVSLTEISCY